MIDEPSTQLVLTPPLATVLAALIALVAGLTGAILTSVVNWRLDVQRWRRAREDARMSDVRVAVNAFLKQFATCSTQVADLTWLATTNEEMFGQAEVVRYLDRGNTLVADL